MASGAGAADGVVAESRQYLVNSPIYSLGVSEDDGTVALGAGGGSAKTGVQNFFRLLSVDETQRDALVDAEDHLTKDVPVTALAFPRGNNSTLFVWATAETLHVGRRSGQKVAELRSVQADYADDCPTVKSLSISCDNRHVAAGGEDGIVRVFSLPSLKEVCTLSVHTDSVNSLDWHPMLKSVLVSTSGNDQCIIWDVDKRQPFGILAPPKASSKERFRACAYGSTGVDLYTVTTMFGGSAHVQQWKLDTDDPSAIPVLNCNPMACAHPVTSLAVNRDGSKLALGSAEGDLIVFTCDRRLSKWFYQPAVHGFFVSGVAFADSQHALWSVGGDGAAHYTRIHRNVRGLAAYFAFLGILLILVALVMQMYTGRFSGSLI